MTEHGEEGRALGLPTGTVTFLLTDVAGSTRLWESRRDAMATALSRHREIIDEAIAKRGGARPVEQGEGDSTVSIFARAADAVLAALDIQQALTAETWPGGAEIRVRIGLHTGEAHLADYGTYVGGALNRCARLRAIGHGGQTLLSRTTADLIVDELPPDIELVDLGEHHLRDLSRPERVYQLTRAGLPSEFPPLASQGRHPNTLPEQITSFIGREQQIEELTVLLEQTRLLTLVGAGGCGKTRLAIEAAGRIADRYRDGVLWVDLSSLSEPSLVPSAIATSLNIREALIQDPTDTIAAYLRERNVLLLLDNCEHLAAACAGFVERILRSCAEVSILTTSREPLGVPAETAWRVPSLTVPSGEGSDGEASESVRLFIDRARKSRPRFRAGESLDAIVTLCRRLDGMPLAIEIAAARIRTMSPLQIATGIADRFSLLGGGARTALPRQRTLEASIDWSFALLSEPERILFRRLAIFAGGFTLDAAEHVCADALIEEFAVMELLSQLVDRSLVQMEDTGGDTRYRLLETVRVYARQKLADSDDAAAMRERHLAFFIEFVERAEDGLQTREMVEWVGRLQRDHDNVRAAIDWSIESRQANPALRLCAALFLFWLYGNHLPEGRRRVDSILALEGGDSGLRARALASAAGTATFVLDDPDAARDFAERAGEIAREVGDLKTIGRSSTYLGFAAIYADPKKGRELFEEGAAASEQSGDWGDVCTALAGLTLAEMFLCEPDRAREAANRALELARSTGHPFQRAQSSCWAGARAVWWGEFETARGCLDESIDVSREIDEHFLLSFALCFRGWLQNYEGNRDEGRGDMDASMAIARRAGFLFHIGICDVFSAEGAYAEGDLGRADALAHEALAIFRPADFWIGVVWALTLIALTKQVRETEAARRLADEALQIARKYSFARDESRVMLLMARLDLTEGSIEAAEEALYQALAVATASALPLESIDTLEEIAGIACVKESFAEGARLLGATNAARLAIGYPLSPIRHEEHQRRVESLRDALGVQEVEAAWNEGGALGLDEAISYATRARGERKRPSHGWASLTPTEVEVVRHLQEGLTNRQIAERMFIAPGTVRIHLQHVFTKLGVKTRAELAAQATRRSM